GPEGEVEIDDDAVELEIARDRPSYIMCDRRCADAAFRTHNGDDSADCYGFRSGEQAADRPHHVEGADGPDDVVVDTTAHQLPIRRLIVLAADNDNACPRIAHGRQFVEARENVALPFALDHDDIWSGCVVIGVDGCGHAALLDCQVSLGEAAVLAGRSYRGRSFLALAKGLHRNAWGRRDVVVRGRRRGVRLLFGLLTGLAHFPVSLSLALSASG